MRAHKLRHRASAAFFVTSKFFPNFWIIGQQASIHSSRAASSYRSFFTSASIQKRFSSVKSAYSPAQDLAKMSEITHPTIKGKSLNACNVSKFINFHMFITTNPLVQEHIQHHAFDTTICLAVKRSWFCFVSCYFWRWA
jgi:hypothetical protein